MRVRFPSASPQVVLGAFGVGLLGGRCPVCGARHLALSVNAWRCFTCKQSGSVEVKIR